MNIYDVSAIELEIDRIAEANGGEIPEDKIQELVIAQTQSIMQIEKLCWYIKHLEQFQDMADAEIKRISGLKSQASNRLESIKQYLTPYVLARGKFDSGTFKLSTRKSTRVDVDADFDVDEYMREKITRSPDKEKIKDALTNGKSIPGAHIIYSDNLQIK